jgi:hypothetical protein
MFMKNCRMIENPRHPTTDSMILAGIWIVCIPNRKILKII